MQSAHVVTTGPMCTFCGRLALSRVEEKERVVNPETKRNLGWDRLVAVFEHADGTQHRVPIAAVFK